MKAAFAIWDNRIAPVFDVARRLHLVEAQGGSIVSQSQECLTVEMPVQRVLHLVGLGVGTLVCGAISRPLESLVVAHGIKVISFVAGTLDEVVQGWLEDKLHGERFAMPGCCGGIMKGRNRGGGGGQGRGGGPSAAGPGGQCLCPRCGHKEPHQRGEPCMERTCPQCGAALVRGES